MWKKEEEKNSKQKNSKYIAIETIKNKINRLLK